MAQYTKSHASLYSKNCRNAPVSPFVWSYWQFKYLFATCLKIGWQCSVHVSSILTVLNRPVAFHVLKLFKVVSKTGSNHPMIKDVTKSYGRSNQWTHSDSIRSVPRAILEWRESLMPSCLVEETKRGTFPRISKPIKKWPWEICVNRV